MIPKDYPDIYNMIRLFIYLLLFLQLSINSCAAERISAEDQRILKKFWQYAEATHLSDLAVNERIPLIAEFFIDTPYRSNTLEAKREELPVINLHEFDCVTFVENVLALAYLPEYHAQAADKFVNNIIRLRYRNGEILDYTSRLHYSSDWLYEMERQHLLTDITAFTGGIVYPNQVNYMSKNFMRYPPLQKDSVLKEKMKIIETDINRRTYHFIPKQSIDQACDKIKNGDVLLITTNIKGLDTSHLGFAYKQGGKTYLLHASSKSKKVTLTEVPLQEYMEGISSQSGIMVARAIKTICTEK